MIEKRVIAAVLMIGDEVLSGRTQDLNLQAIAKFLAPLGVQVGEARVVADIPEKIVAAVNELRANYDYLITTGGIGPTHDDKTADAVAAAFGVGIDVRDDAAAILRAHYKNIIQRDPSIAPSGLNEARLRMARIPDGATLIDNPVSKAPGFQIGNVFVLAGVPSVMRGMLIDVGKRIEGGAVVRSRTIRGAKLREGDVAVGLAELEANAPGVTFGSYPWFGPEGYGTHLVARSADPAALDKAEADMIALARQFGVEAEVLPES